MSENQTVKALWADKLWALAKSVSLAATLNTDARLLHLAEGCLALFDRLGTVERERDEARVALASLADTVSQREVLMEQVRDLTHWKWRLVGEQNVLKQRVEDVRVALGEVCAERDEARRLLRDVLEAAEQRTLIEHGGGCECSLCDALRDTRAFLGGRGEMS